MHIMIHRPGKLVVPVAALLFSALVPAAAQARQGTRSRPTLQEEEELPPILQDKQAEKASEGGSEFAEAKPAFDTVELTFNFYEQDDQGGNPRVDEKVQILQPMLLVAPSLSEDWKASLLLQGDVILADTQSGASSRGTEVNFGGGLNLTHLWSRQTTLSGGLTYFRESDYQSVGANLKWAYSTEDLNDTVAVGLTALIDKVWLEYFDGTNEGLGHRQTWSPGIGWMHVLGPGTVLTLNYDLTFQDGVLSQPIQSVFFGATEVREELPDSRTRHSLFGRVRHLLLEDLSAELGVGYYWDDWGARAYTAEVRLFWEAIPDTVILRPGFRYHSQDAVDYFIPEGATTITEYRTQDSDLGEFTSAIYSMRVSFLHAPLIGDELDIDISFADRSDGIGWYTVTVGFTWK